MVKILEIGKKPRIAAIAEAAAAIRAGGLVIYPTETVYGLGADACSDEAVIKVFNVKARPVQSPVPIAVSSLKMAEQFAEITPLAKKIFKKLLPGPIMVILSAKPGLSKLVTAGTGKVGVRVPDHPVALRLIEFVGSPITSTSANLSGKPAPSNVKAAIKQIGKNVDIALDSGGCALGVPSTIIDVFSGELKIIRRGPLSEEKIRKLLK